MFPAKFLAGRGDARHGVASLCEARLFLAARGAYKARRLLPGSLATCMGSDTYSAKAIAIQR